MNLSIIIVNYNTIDCLRECLQSVEKYKSDKMEVFVVDNASSDGSSEMVEQNFPDVTLIKSAVNLGFAGGNNQAIVKSSGRYIMLLNSDTIMLEGTLEKIVAFMDNDPKIGVVGCKLLNSDGSLQPSVTSFPGVIKDTVAIALKGSGLKNTPAARKIISLAGKILGVSASRFDDHSEIKEIDFPRGACFTIRKETVDEIGLMDEDYFFTAEEMDWCYRAKQKAWKVVYYPEVAVIHHDHGATKKVMGKVFVQTRKGTLQFYEKHYGAKRTTMMKLGVSKVLLMKCFFISLRLLFTGKDRKILLAQREANWTIVKVHYNRKFRELNVFTEMKFRYN